MSDKPETGVKDLAGGWITERTGTKVPVFLKLAYVGFSLFGILYLFLYAAGETKHATRGALVEQLNQVSRVPGMAWIGFLGIVLVLFVVGLFVTAFSGHDESEEG